MADNYDASMAAAISAGVETMNMVSASSGSRKARNHASTENNKAREWNEQMWAKNNAWNEQVTDPKYKMDRLKNAGINPHLAYSNGSDFANPTSGSAPTSVSPMTPNVPQQYAMQSQGMLQALMMQSQIANINADTKVKETTATSNVTLNGINLNTLANQSTVIDQENTLRGINIASGNLNLNLTTEQINNAKQDIVNKISTNQSIQQGINESVTRMGLNEAQTAKYIADLGVIRATVQNIQANTNYTNEKSKSESVNRDNTRADTFNKREQGKGMQRANTIGEKYDYNQAENTFQQSSTQTKTAVQMFLQAEKGNTMLDKKITAQDYTNDLLLLESVEKTGTLPANIGKSYLPWTKPNSTTTTRFDNQGEYNGHTTTRQHR